MKIKQKREMGLLNGIGELSRAMKLPHNWVWMMIRDGRIIPDFIHEKSNQMFFTYEHAEELVKKHFDQKNRGIKRGRIYDR